MKEEQKTDSIFLTTTAAARMLGLAAQTLNYWRSQNKNLNYVKLGKRCLYRKSDIDEFINKSVVNVAS
ncbi:MAG: helix-turn-helix domain-containing protein [Desulfamplus sp.]|nr:helix-turn-helix domain-containing protein [Desulfamplus sp.]MBF0388603.1 helix-turn-helix domain-containing protein [Desulfamplus sp.]